MKTLMEKIKEIQEMQYIYTTQNIDSGNDYIMCCLDGYFSHNNNQVLIDWLNEKEIKYNDSLLDNITDFCINNVEPISGHMFTDVTKLDGLTLAWWPVVEIETQIELSELDANKEQVQELIDSNDICGTVDNDHVLVYQTCDCIWFAVVDEELLLKHVHEYVYF